MITQAVVLYYSLCNMENNNDEKIPQALQVLYHAVLNGEIDFITCRKKIFREHYVIKAKEKNYGDKFKLHITPEKMWWEYKW